MWVLTSFGAFMPALRHADDVADGDDRLIQVRARRERDLLLLKRLYLPDGGSIVRNAGTDYEVRLYCTHEQWAEAMRKMAMDIDYTSFKNTTDRWHDDQLHKAYLRVWNTLYSVLGTRRAFDVKVSTRVRHGKKGKGKSLTREVRKDWWDDGSFEIDYTR